MESPEETLMDIMPYELSAHVIFSVTSREDKKFKLGLTLARFIRKNNLGVVVSTKPSINPGHRGTLRAWIWTPNKRAFKRWQAKMKKANPEKYARAITNPYYTGYHVNNWW
jgi:hypothetical protein